ncbi:MAG: hypothetical protein ABI333_28805 [bacterium]
MADETLRKELEETKKKLEALQSRGAKGITFKVSEKGGLSVYGLGRFPVTLYKEQWLKLLALHDDIHAFIKEHSDQLKTKADK